MDSWPIGWHGAYLEINGQVFCEEFISEEQEANISIGGSPTTSKTKNIIIFLKNNYHSVTVHPKSFVNEMGCFVLIENAERQYCY